MSAISPKPDAEHNNELCALIEGLRRGDAEFYGRWLLPAAQFDRIWKDLIANDAIFRDRTLAPGDAES